MQQIDMKGPAVTTGAYHITIEGELDDLAAAAFPDLRLERVCGATRFHTPELDQAGLNGVLDRLRMIGAVLLELQCDRQLSRG